MKRKTTQICTFPHSARPTRASLRKNFIILLYVNWLCCQRFEENSWHKLWNGHTDNRFLSLTTNQCKEQVKKVVTIFLNTWQSFRISLKNHRNKKIHIIYNSNTIFLSIGQYAEMQWSENDGFPLQNLFFFFKTVGYWWNLMGNVTLSEQYEKYEDQWKMMHSICTWWIAGQQCVIHVLIRQHNSGKNKGKLPSNQKLLERNEEKRESDRRLKLCLYGNGLHISHT